MPDLDVDLRRVFCVMTCDGAAHSQATLCIRGDGDSQSENLLLIDVLAVHAKDRFECVVFVNLYGHYWAPKFLWMHESQALK